MTKRGQRSFGANARPLRWPMFAYGFLPAALLFRKGAPDKGDDLRSRAVVVGAERGGGALGDAVLHSPVDSLLIVAAGGHIHKHAGLGVAAGLHKDDLDGVVLLHVLEGVGLHRAHPQPAFLAIFRL